MPQRFIPNPMPRKLIAPALCAYSLSVCLAAVSSAQSPTSSARADILAKASDASVLILTGEGAGRLQSVASGVIVRPDGVILTAYHAIKDAHEVQLRLHNGEVYDRVELLGFDERRDVAALKISARQLPALSTGSATDTTVGSPVYAITSSDKQTWSETEGILSAIRPADEVPGAGNGYRLVQFTAPIAPGASGGTLLGPGGAIIGIITRGGPGGTAFAVPIESVLGLPDEAQHIVLGASSAPQLAMHQDSPVAKHEEPPVAGRVDAQPPKHEDAPVAAAVKSSQPEATLKSARSASITSHSIFLPAISLDRAMVKEKDFGGLNLLLVPGRRPADVAIEIDRPALSYQWTYSITDSRTSIVLCSGKVTAADGDTAAGLLAHEITNQFVKARQ